MPQPLRRRADICGHGGPRTAAFFRARAQGGFDGKKFDDGA